MLTVKQRLPLLQASTLHTTNETECVMRQAWFRRPVDQIVSLRLVFSATCCGSRRERIIGSGGVIAR
jgi:hypothetical protein